MGHALLCLLVLGAAPHEVDRTALKPGLRLEGIVKNVTDYGCFVDVGGIDGLAHITDLSWAPLERADQVCHKGKPLKVVVLNWNPQTERLALGVKQLTANPWDTAATRYPVGKKVKGTLSHVTDYGAYFTLEPGVEGLLHVSEFVEGFAQRANVGTKEDVVVLDVNAAEGRILLGLASGKKVKPSDSAAVLVERMKETIANLRASLHVLEPMARAGGFADDELDSARSMAKGLLSDAKQLAERSKATGKSAVPAATALIQKLDTYSAESIAAARAELEKVSAAVDQHTP